MHRCDVHEIYNENCHDDHNNSIEDLVGQVQSLVYH